MKVSQSLHFHAVGRSFHPLYAPGYALHIVHPECFRTPTLKTFLHLIAFSRFTNAQLHEHKSARARKRTDARASRNVRRHTHALSPPSSAHMVCVSRSTHATMQKHAQTQYAPFCTCTRTNTDACARADERMHSQVAFFCVGGERVRTRSDANISIENFQDVQYYCVPPPIPVCHPYIPSFLSVGFLIYLSHSLFLLS